MTQRLSLATLDQGLIHENTQGLVQGPAVDPRAVSIGIVHLGIGAFHRAHQAVYTEKAAAKTGETHWGILGVTQRSRTVADQLNPQDGLYAVLQKGTTDTELHLIGSIRDVAYPATDFTTIIEVLAAPSTHIVSLTVTEKGYRATSQGTLDLTNSELAADIAAVHELHAQQALEPATGPLATPMGLLAYGLIERARAALTNAGPQVPGGITVLCCDNMVNNGHVVRELIREFLDHVGVSEGTAERDWIDANTTYPNTMVDRIVPATTAAHRDEAEHILGLRDEGLVVAEPFTQWVIEDNFAGPRPRWETAGATLTTDVAPFEQAKLRMLNGTHSLLAYLGALADLPLIADAVNDPEIARVARDFLAQDVIPTLHAPEGVDLHEYAQSLVERFANPNTGHTTIQVAMDGSKKLPYRIFGTVSDCLAHGHLPHSAARAIAGWLVFVSRGHSASGQPLVLDDPRAHELARATGREGETPLEVEEIVGNVWALDDLVPQDVAQHPEFAAAVCAAMRELLA